MKPERWEKIEQLYHAALERAPAARAAFLDGACAGDQTLRHEVESLLAYDESAQHFITTPPDAFAAGLLAAGPAPLLIGTNLNHYQILAPLGHGGMGEVFLAADTELGRKVALKLLPALWMSDPERVRRFKQEARAASALNHPNILTIHEIGEVGQRHFIVSEFVEGETLRQRMQSGPLAPEAALEIAAQVASALAAAHRAGIMHRDIKPENVMVRPDGLVKVLDFGLAKLTEPSHATVDRNAPASNQSLTEPGQVMGTTHYMSPEQARGAGVDARSDIFSLGVVLYEMVAGKPPFVGTTPTDVIISIVQQEPEPLARYAPEAPPALEQVVAKALCKDRAERYQTANELLLDLKGLKQRLELEDKLEPGSDVAARHTWPWRKVAAVALGTLLLVIAWLWLAQRQPESPAPVIAVLPFNNLSAEPESEYFVDGLTDEIIRNLALIEGLEVRSRTSSFAFKDKPRNIREVGEQLKVNFVVDGSVLRSAGNLRINAQFVRVSDDVPLWSGRFDRELKDVFTIQDEISRAIVNELRLKLGRGKRRYDTNVETYDLYLKARSLGSDLNPGGTMKSADLFEQVIIRDPTFAPAHAGLAHAYSTMSYMGLQALDPLNREAAFTKMRPAAERALQLDPLLDEAHAAMGVVYMRDSDWGSAEKAFRRAIELNPNLVPAYLGLAHWVLCPTGRLEEALQEIDKAIRADPLSVDLWEQRAFVLINAGRYDEAIESSRRALGIDPKNFLARQDQARALLQKGRSGEAIAILEQLGETSGGQLGYAYAITGRRAEAEALAAKDTNFPNRLAFIYAGLGDKDRVLDALEGMAARRDPRVQFYLGYPELALIRGDPRLAAFRKKVGLQ